MKWFLVAGPLLLLAPVALAQSLPTVPSLPSAAQPTVTTPSIPSAPTVTAPTVTTPTAPGTSSTMSAIEKAKMEAECKLPANATKPECLKLLLKP